ncbi:NADH-ubiquinone oxidoreductase chain J [gamma proteobacterium IMCC2047]|nr:NADH-ubiquinone oxidoreductase chain J [gamma proteobacterium IMCC2047]
MVGVFKETFVLQEYFQQGDFELLKNRFDGVRQVLILIHGLEELIRDINGRAILFAELLFVA